MAVEALIGSLIGGILRMAPEVLSFMDKKNERKHELALGDQQYRVAELQFSTQRNIKELDLEQSQFVSAMEALKEGIAAQANLRGLNGLMPFHPLSVRLLLRGYSRCIRSSS